MSVAKSLGHILLAGMFISGGASSFSNPDSKVPKVANSGIPNPRQAVILNGAAMVIGGAALAAGIFPKLAATILIGTLIPTTVVGHAFWQEDSPAGQTGQQIQFLKNAAMVGGLLLVLAEQED